MARTFLNFIRQRPALTAALGLLAVALAVAGYFGLERFLAWTLVRAARSIIEKENKGQLSRDYGYVWSEINLAAKMRKTNLAIIDAGSETAPDSARDGESPTPVENDFPSLAAVRELNRLHEASNFIRVTDRRDSLLAEIKTTHTRLPLSEFNEVLIQAIVSSEDQHWKTRALAYEYKAFVRAFFQSFLRAARTFSLPHPRGTSTLHQQVAKLLLSKFDARGYVYSERTLARKWRELKLAQALKMYYGPDEILEVYLNHCVSAGYGMTGYGDVSMGLFGKKPAELDICQSLYLARLVKWNRNLPAKIIAQVGLDLPRMAPALNWDRRTQDSILSAMNRLTFLKPARRVSGHQPLIDLANEYWLAVCRQNGMPEEEIEEMDFTQPNTMIRRKGNLKIQLTIDLRLQKMLEQLVDARGFGADTAIVTDIRIGSMGEDTGRRTLPKDTLRLKKALPSDSFFSEPGSRYSVALQRGDTLITNIRYHRLGPGRFRRSCYFYRRDSLRVPGQYYAYAAMNAGTKELLAYYSRDGVGSRLSSLLRNKTPNGSSVAKPILYALNFDLGHFQPSDMESDSVEVARPAPWARTFLKEKGKAVGMIYLNTSAPGGYPVSNHGKIFEGYDYLFNHLTESNNLLGVEMIYRLDGAALLGGEPLTGAQNYARIAQVVGVEADSIADAGGRIPMPPDYYSVALGTLELTLYQQLHLFNVLYNNQLVEAPETHPSLVVKSISISGEEILFADPVDRRTLFSYPARLKPVLLGLHKRLVSNPADGLQKYDVSADGADTVQRPLSNFAKSGTSDDIIRPYNRDAATRERTNYGLWNAVLRLNLPGADSLSPTDTLDVTLACVAECNEKNTGARDGKTLHKYVSAGLLHAFGVPLDSGFFKGYEREIVENTPDSVRFRNPYEAPAIDSSLLAEIRKKTEGVRAGEPLRVKKDWFFSGIHVSGDSYLQLLSFTRYMGANAAEYHGWVEQLKESGDPREMSAIVERMKKISTRNRVFQSAYDTALRGLSASILENIKE